MPAHETKATTRTARLRELLSEHGCATECDDLIVQLDSDHDAPLPRYALMETDAGPADNGGPWWQLGDDPAKLVEDSLTQEYPEDWPPEYLFDLDSGQQVVWELRVVLTEPVMLTADYDGKRWMVHDYFYDGKREDRDQVVLKRSPDDRRRRSYDWLIVPTSALSNIEWSSV